MVSPQILMGQSVWLNQSKYEEAESLYQAALAGTAVSRGSGLASNLVNEIVEARQKIQAALTTPVLTYQGGSGCIDTAVLDRLSLLEKENKDLKKVTQDLRNLVLKLEGRVSSLEKGAGIVGGSTTTASAAADDEDEEDDDSDFELFGDDPEAAAEAEKVREERVAQYKEKKSKKPTLIAKSSLLIDVKPWDDETDMKEVEKCVRTIVMDGLLWGTSKLVPVGYGIKKLQITAVIEDAKVLTDDLEEAITAFDDYVQSMDIAAFNKI